MEYYNPNDSKGINSNLWLNKYRPKSISEIDCNKDVIKQIIKLLKENTKSTIIISGNHGIGKTCAIMTILEELKFNIKIINFNKIKIKNIPEILNSMINNNNVLSMINNEENKTVLVIDNLDSITSKTDICCINELVSLNDKKKIIPIILIGNNKHNKFISELKKKAIASIKMKSPNVNEMYNIIKKISEKEKINWENDKIITTKFIPHCQYDLQRLISLLQELKSVNNETPITSKNLTKFCDISKKKDLDNDLWKSSDNLIFKYDGINNILQNYESDKVNLPLMIQQNYIKTLDTKNPACYSVAKNISESLSFGDIIENYIYGNQNWSLYDVHGFYSCVLPSFLINTLRNKDDFKLTYPEDFYRTSIKYINKKNIGNIDEYINNLNIDDYIYLNQIIKYHIDFDNIEDEKNVDSETIQPNCVEGINKIAELFSGYNFNASNIDKILKIDKIKAEKITLTSKYKKELNKILNNN